MKRFGGSQTFFRLTVVGISALSAGALSLTVAVPVVLAPAAQASDLTNAQAQAAALAQTITSEQNQVNQLANEYDGAEYNLSQVQAQVASAKTQLAAAQAKDNSVTSQVVSEAIDQYTNGGFEETPAAVASAKVDPVVAQSYFALATGTQSDLLDQLKVTQQTLTTQQANLATEESQAAQAVTTVNTERQAAAAAAATAQATLSSLNGQIAVLVAQQQAAEQAAELAAYQAQQAQTAATAAAKAAAAKSASSTSSGSGSAAQSATVSVAIPPASGSVIARAIAVALAQVGKPYVYGAEGPDSFDCSGLVTYAFAAAGVSLTHYTVAQWDETTHVPTADMAPGDLVFFDDFGHVGIYLGGGDMVNAPHTGTDVQVDPIAYFGPISGVSEVG